MNDRLEMLLLMVAIISVGTTASADRISAETLGKRLSGSVRSMVIQPVWAPDDTALYFNEDDQIMRVDTASGETTPMIDYAAIREKTGFKDARIERFSIADTGEALCLVSSSNECSTLSIDGTRIERIASSDDPFALQALSSNEPLYSGSSVAESTVFFVNDTEQPVELAWVDASGLRKPYATVEPGMTRRQHTYASHVWLAGSVAFVASSEPSTAYLGMEPEPSEAKTERIPEGRWTACFRDGNLYVTNCATGKERRVTEDGSADWKYCEPAIESPNGRYMIAIREKAGDNRTIDLIHAAPTDRLQPRTETIPYPKPGDRIPERKPCLFDLQTTKQIPIDDSLFANPWSIDEFHWSPDSKRLFFVYNQRGHQIVRLLSVEVATGRVSIVAEEESKTFIDYTNKLSVHYLDETDEVVWMSERSGWNHLYLIDRKTGKTSPITTGEWVVRGIERIDSERREILFRACGIYPGMDPYYIQYARASFDGSNLTMLTEGNGTHEVRFSPKGEFYVDSWSRVDLPPIHELHRSSDGQRMMILGKADASNLLKIHPYLPEPFRAKGRDGETDIFGVVYRPSDFDPTMQYPVVESMYAGPHDQFVPKSFSPYRYEQRLAELGFIVVQIDGMGTNWRSKQFHDVCWKNLKDAGFPDRIAWMKAAAQQYPCMDLSRVGIYGGSAGGQSAMRAVIDHADFYKVAAADCGCHDNRMDKIWWNEQWMGWPVDESYAKNSNVVDARKLGGKLLLTVGALDSNVDPSSTMQVVDALIKADKHFELMVFPSDGHGAGDSPYGMHLRETFFLKNLQ